MATVRVRSILLLTTVFLNLAPITAYSAAPACETVWRNEQQSSPTASAGYVLSLSGGGYRAMLFHLGVLKRLNDAGLLERLDMVSSVSGGSITAGILAKAWAELNFENGVATRFDELVQGPLMGLANRTIDAPSVLMGFLPFTAASDQIERRYEEYLFGEMQLDQLPDRPAFVFNATSLQTGEIWHFGKNRMGGQRTGWTSSNGIGVSRAVAASSAFPPMLGPVEIESGGDRIWCDDQPEEVGFGANQNNIAAQVIPEEIKKKLRKRLVLVDGGVRDNLGFVALDKQSRAVQQLGRCNTVQMVSDGGATYLPDPEPSSNWISQAMRVINIGLSEPDQLRIEALVEKARRNDTSSDVSPHQGNCTPDTAFWSIQRLPKWHKEYVVQSAKKLAAEDIVSIGSISTRLAALDEISQKQIVNWGYLAAHYGLPFVNGLFGEPEKLNICRLPFPETGISEGTINARLCPSLFR